MADQRVPIPGSEPKHEPASRRLYVTDPQQPVQATIVLRGKGGKAPLAAEARALQAGQFQSLAPDAGRPGDAADVATVEQFARQYGLTVVEESATERALRVSGTVRQMDSAFGIHLADYEDPSGGNYMSWDGSLTAPAPVAAAIIAVLGLDQREVGQRH